MKPCPAGFSVHVTHVHDTWSTSLGQDSLVAPDDAETQPMSDSQNQLSPVHSMQPLSEERGELQRGTATSDLSVGKKMQAAETEELESEVEIVEEGEEEEGGDSDVIVEVEYQDNNTIQILSDDEHCVMSPEKPKMEEVIPEGFADNVYSQMYGLPTRPQQQDGVPDVLPETQPETNMSPPKSPEKPAASLDLESVADSAKDGKMSKQDRKKHQSLIPK